MGEQDFPPSWLVVDACRGSIGACLPGAVGACSRLKLVCWDRRNYGEPLGVVYAAGLLEFAWHRMW
eukprot:1051199-Alexandrium_andersonii.AAC.1